MTSSVRIHIENTPNPKTLKFVASTALLESGGRDFPSMESALASPLAKRVFQISGVEGVYIGTNFVSITKTDAADWQTLAPTVTESILAHLASDEPILGTEGVQSHAAADDSVAQRVQDILDEFVRPAVAQDGGDVIFDSYEDGVVRLHLQGACSGCPSSTMTLKMGIQNMLCDQIPEVREVIQV